MSVSYTHLDVYKRQEFDGMECKNGGFAYDKEQILENFNMEIPKNKIIAINGPSGSGKSTALKPVSYTHL